MKYKILVLMAVFVMILSVQVHAAGIKWNTQSEIIEEGREKCIDYGIYNPFENPVMATVSLDGDLEKIGTVESSRQTYIESYTSSKDAVPVKVCFTAPKVSQDNCLLGPLACEKSCTQNRVTYSGNFIVTDSPTTGGATGLSGSKVTVSASAPLDIDVQCMSSARDYTTTLLLVVSIVVVVLVVTVRRKRTPSVERKEKKIKKLEEQLEREKKIE